MTVAAFANGTITLRRIGIEFSAEMSEFAAKELRDQLLARYPVEPEATPVAGPLHEVTLAEARPGDIAMFEIKPLPSRGKFVCTLKKNVDDMALYADEWLTANKLNVWCIRTHSGEECTFMKDLHIWRWDGVEETAEAEAPAVAGWYITATSDQMLYNDGDACANWSRPNGVKWSTGSTYESWEVVARDLGSERLPLKFILEGED